MGKNVGTVDRIIRIVIGLVLIAYAIPLGFSHTGWNWVGWIGVVPRLSADWPIDLPRKGELAVSFPHRVPKPSADSEVIRCEFPDRRFAPSPIRR